MAEIAERLLSVPSSAFDYWLIVAVVTLLVGPAYFATKAMGYYGGPPLLIRYLRMLIAPRAIKRGRADDTTDSRPPKAALGLIFLVFPKKYRDDLRGDLEEEYTTIVLPELGPSWAKLWYWKQVLTSIAPIVRPRILKAAKWLGGLSGGVGLLELLRRLAGS